MRLTDIPLPPTVNSLFAGKTRRRKSPKYRAWEKEFEMWAIGQWGTIAKLRSWGHQLTCDPKQFLTLRIDMHLPRQKLYSKTGDVKKIDCTNRIKPLLDALANILHLDDNRYFLAGVEFCIYDGDQLPTVDVEFKNTRIRENVKRT